MLSTARTIYNYYGLSALFRGASFVVLREAAWATTYLAAVPILSNKFQKSGYKKIESDFMALLISAGMFGLVTAPINRARIMKQENLAKTGTANVSYKKIFGYMLHEAPNAPSAHRIMRFFKGAGARSATSVLAGGLIFKGKEMYDEAIRYSKNN
ncbi:MAG: hypothetical protein P1U74_07000 [Legionellaceae bacterium]|nr:hypothetical protein [Legionellaceae bacterium]